MRVRLADTQSRCTRRAVRQLARQSESSSKVIHWFDFEFNSRVC
jgi:hypothetical protein